MYIILINRKFCLTSTRKIVNKHLRIIKLKGSKTPTFLSLFFTSLWSVSIFQTRHILRGILKIWNLDCIINHSFPINGSMACIIWFQDFSWPWMLRMNACTMLQNNQWIYYPFSHLKSDVHFHWIVFAVSVGVGIHLIILLQEDRLSMG